MHCKIVVWEIEATGGTPEVAAAVESFAAAIGAKTIRPAGSIERITNTPHADMPPAPIRETKPAARETPTPKRETIADPVERAGPPERNSPGSGKKVNIAAETERLRARLDAARMDGVRLTPGRVVKIRGRGDIKMGRRILDHYLDDRVPTDDPPNHDELPGNATSVEYRVVQRRDTLDQLQQFGKLTLTEVAKRFNCEVDEAKATIAAYRKLLESETA